MEYDYNCKRLQITSVSNVGQLEKMLRDKRKVNWSKLLMKTALLLATTALLIHEENVRFSSQRLLLGE